MWGGWCRDIDATIIRHLVLAWRSWKCHCPSPHIEVQAVSTDRPGTRFIPYALTEDQMCDPGPRIGNGLGFNNEPAADSSVNPFNKDRLGTSGNDLSSELSDAKHSMMEGCRCFADVSDLGAVCRPSG